MLNVQEKQGNNETEETVDMDEVSKSQEILDDSDIEEDADEVTPEESDE